MIDSNRFVFVSHCSFCLHLLHSNNVENIFILFLKICFFDEIYVQISCLFLFDLLFSYYWVLEFFWDFVYNSFVRYVSCRLFSQVCDFILLNERSSKIEVSNFDEVHLINFLKRSLSNQRSQRFSPILLTWF